MITYGQVSDIGRVQKINADAVYSQVISGSGAYSHPDIALFIVADGGGGQPADEMADLLIRTLVNQLCRVLILPCIDNYIPLSDKSIEETLEAAFEEANQAIYSKFYLQDDFNWAGVTATAVFILDKSLYIVHVGHTRVVILQQNKAERLTRIHDMAHALLEHGHVESLQEAYNASPVSDVLSSSFGGERLHRIDVSKHRFDDKSVLVLSTGGINRRENGLSESEILAIVSQSYHPQDACQRLVNTVNAKGGHDNVSVILVSNQFPFKTIENK